MKKRFLIIIFSVLIAVFLAVNCALPPYSQVRIMQKTKQMLTEGEENLEKWFVDDKRVSIDSLVKISSPNITQYDSVRMTIFNAIAEIKDTAILKLMSVKVVSGNPIEKLTASAYIYQYYGVKMKIGEDIPLASMLVLFHATADKLKNKNSPLYKSIELKNEIANTFPQSENLYREFILNKNLEYSVRAWFVESLLEAEDREIAAAFFMDLETELDGKDPVFSIVNEAVYTLMSSGVGGNWIAH